MIWQYLRMQALLIREEIYDQLYGFCLKNNKIALNETPGQLPGQLPGKLLGNFPDNFGYCLMESSQKGS